MEETRYADAFIYVPSVREIVRIAEGNGTNLLDEDEAEGYVDYIYYDQHELSSGMPECDGGQVMLTELNCSEISSAAQKMRYRQCWIWHMEIRI